MHDQEQDDRRHPEEVHYAREIEAAEQEGELLELAGLQIEPGQHGDGAGRQHADIERLLHRVVGAEPVRQPERQRGNGVAQDGRGADRQERAPEMSRQESIGDVDEAVEREQPHAGEMPLRAAPASPSSLWMSTEPS